MVCKNNGFCNVFVLHPIAGIEKVRNSMNWMYCKHFIQLTKIMALWKLMNRKHRIIMKIPMEKVLINWMRNYWRKSKLHMLTFLIVSEYFFLMCSFFSVASIFRLRTAIAHSASIDSDESVEEETEEQRRKSRIK